MSKLLRSLELRVARLERQAVTKMEAHKVLRDFIAQNKTNLKLVIELGRYLKILEGGGDLSEQALKSIRKVMHNQNASDLAEFFRSNPTGSTPTPPPPKEETLTVEEVYYLLRGSSTRTGGKLSGRGIEEEDTSPWWVMEFEPRNRQRLDHYVGRNYYPSEDEDNEGWDEEGWWDEWANPLTEEIEALLVRGLPIFKTLRNSRDYFLEIDDKGFVTLYLSKAKFKRE